MSNQNPIVSKTDEELAAYLESHPAGLDRLLAAVAPEDEPTDDGDRWELQS
jgi:hypothetical protein